MEDFLKKGTILNLISTIIFFVIGIVLVTMPITMLSIVTYVVEATLMIIGIIEIINYVRVESKNDTFSFGFVQGVVCILLSLFLIINPTFLTTILPIVMGIWMIFGSLARIQIAIKLTTWGQKASAWYIFLAIIMFTVGLVVVCNPFKTATLIVEMLGAGIVVYTVFDIIQNLGILRFLNNMNR